MVCKNCNTEFVGNFCPVCGAVVVPEIKDVEPPVLFSVEHKTSEPITEITEENDVADENYEAPELQNDVQSETQPKTQLDTQPDEDAAYKAAAKKYWYCFLLPILFFIPISDEYKKYDCNKDVASNVLWIFILNFACTIVSRILASIGGGFMSSMALVVNLIGAAVGIFAIVAAIKGAKGNGIRVPLVGDKKIFK